MLSHKFIPNYWKFLLVLSFIISLNFPFHLHAGNHKECINCFSTEVIEYTVDDDCINIQLKITSSTECKFALSHYSVEIPCGEVSNITNSEGWKIESPSKDPTTGINGFKIDDIQGFGEDKKQASFTISYTICANSDCINLMTEGFKVAYKAGTCVFYEDIELSQKLSAHLIANHVSCFGGNNGNLSVEVKDGIPPYAYQWSNGNTNGSISNLKAGTYFVLVTDASGNSVELEATLIQPEASLSVEASITPPSCNNNNGSLSLNVTGGTAPYQYYWNNGKTSNTLENIYGGSYTLQIIDANGCSLRKTFEVNEETDFKATLKPNFLECYQEGEGTVESIVTGGEEPYSYVWSTQDTTTNLSQLNSGRYSLSVTDANGCTAEASTYIGIKKMMLSTSVLNPTCFGETDGEVGIADVTYGNEPYTYLWNTGDTIQKLTDVSSGSYRVTVTDIYGCSASRTINLAGRPEININHSILRSNCSVENTSAEIDLTINGGTPNYKVYLNGEIVILPLTVTAIGDYTFTVIDALGCEKTHTVSINNVVSNISVIANVAQPACGGEKTGSVQLISSGGEEPYRYIWNDGATMQNRDHLSSGSYTAEVIDNNGCTNSIEIVIDSISIVQAKITDIPNFSCETENNSIEAISTGSSSYNWEILNNDSYIINSESINMMIFDAGIGEAQVIYSVFNDEGCFDADTITINCDNSDNGENETPIDSIPEYNDDCFISSIEKIQHLNDNCYLFEMRVHTNGECAHELSHLTIGLNNGWVVSAENSENWKMESNLTDPKTGIYGLKVDDISGFGQNGSDNFKVTFEVCFSNPDGNNYFPDHIIVAYKAANNFTTQTINLVNEVPSEKGISAQIYPNPFVTEGLLDVMVEKDTYADIFVYDIYGNKVQTLYNGTLKSAINYTFKITGGTSHENIFFYKILTPNKVLHGKVLKAN
ncbi:SprB repeat-containing protein [Labilibacter marinus]|uniref:SprB repeat-containing protein n=1 Tax=Labilibacter marinus TaxID=1477105 RepID=UPI00083274E3|nr:SprB repeat-containing protein [Labilibacter marinus]